MELTVLSLFVALAATTYYMKPSCTTIAATMLPQHRNIIIPITPYCCIMTDPDMSIGRTRFIIDSAGTWRLTVPKYEMDHLMASRGLTERQVKDLRPKAKVWV